MTSPNREQLVRTARRLHSLLGDLVFVGGQVAELLVTDPAAVRIRPTEDVDVIVRLATLTAWHALQERLRMLGFEPDTREGAPICRSRSRDGLVLDVMPLDDAILGFSNRWYPHAIDTATTVVLEPDLAIRAIGAPAFLATKWEAFAGRGAGDMSTSDDVEDILTLVAGRASIVDELAAAPDELRDFVQEWTRRLLAHRWVDEMIDSAVPDARYVPGLRKLIVERLRALAEDRGSARGR